MTKVFKSYARSGPITRLVHRVRVVTQQRREVDVVFGARLDPAVLRRESFRALMISCRSSNKTFTSNEGSPHHYSSWLVVVVVAYDPSRIISITFLGRVLDSVVWNRRARCVILQLGGIFNTDGTTFEFTSCCRFQRLLPITSSPARSPFNQRSTLSTKKQPASTTSKNN